MHSMVRFVLTYVVFSVQIISIIVSYCIFLSWICRGFLLIEIDGIYVLLRPDKKKNRKKHEESPAIPPHLAHLEMENPPLERCQWSLSGPQFPRPTAIQQRYCYPKGNPAYASQKGGALWTMYSRDGDEDDEFRLLHVYFSVKRAANKGISQDSYSTSSKNSISSKNSAKSKRKPKRKVATTDDGSTISAETYSTKQKRSKSKTKPKSRSNRLPLMPGALPPPSPCKVKNSVDQHPFANVSPNTASTSSMGIQRNESSDGCFGGLNFHPIPSFMANEVIYSSGNDHLTPTSSEPNRCRSPGDIFRRSHSTYHHPGSHATNMHHCFPDQLAPSLDLDTLTGLPFSDPSFTTRDPVTEMLALPNVQQRTIPRHRPNESFSEVLVKKLDVLHDRIIREWVLSRPNSERGQLLSIVANWALRVSRSPLEVTRGGERVKEQRDDDANGNARVAALMMEDGDKAVAV